MMEKVFHITGLAAASAIYLHVQVHVIDQLKISFRPTPSG